jgi:multiple sugar transport system permease protein
MAQMIFSDSPRTYANRAAIRPMTKRELREERWAYAFVLPQFLGILLFVLLPVLASVVLCFTEWDMIGSAKFVGLDNLTTILSAKRLGQAFGNTGLFAVGIIPITTALSLAMALLANAKMRGLGIYKCGLFLPMTTSSVAIVLVWYWIYAPNVGIINYVLSLMGIQGPLWLIQVDSARWAIIIMAVWQNMGYYFLIFLAGLKGIPRDYYEAASIDGAGTMKKFFRITLPMLSPTIFFVMITLTIGVLNIFQEPGVLTQGGPSYGTYSIVMYIYDLAFKFFRMGEAAVVSIFLFLMVVAVTYIQFKTSGKWVYADEA